MDLVRLAGLPGHRDRNAASDGRRADLCQALCPFYAGGKRQRRRSGCAPDLAITVGTEQHPDASFEQRPGGQLPAATPDSRPPIDRPDQPRSARRIKAIPLTGADATRLRDRLLAEVEGLTCEEDLDVWSMRSWRDANVLASADGVIVRQAFAARLNALRRPEPGSSGPRPRKASLLGVIPPGYCARRIGDSSGSISSSSSDTVSPNNPLVWTRQKSGNASHPSGVCRK